MDEKDIDKIIAEYNIMIISSSDQKVKKITTCKQFSNYVETEIKNWKIYKEQYKISFSNKILNKLQLILNDIKNFSTYNTLTRDNIEKIIDTLHLQSIIPSHSTITQIILQRYKYESVWINKAYDLLYRQKILNNFIHERGEVMGWYNLLFNAKNNFINRSTNNKILNQLVSNYEKELEKIKTSVNNEKEKYTQLINKIKTKSDDMMIKNLSFFNDEKAKHSKNINELSYLYEEKLRLNAASTHWKKYQKGKFCTSIWFFTIAAIFMIGLCSYLTCLGLALDTILYKTTKTMEIIPGQSIPIEKESKSDEWDIEKIIKWFILVSLVVSLVIYFIRQMIKIAMSNMHLSQDAAERRELSHQYLALLKKVKGAGNISENERIIILQALFSRSESGLFKHDSGPILPGANILENIAKK